jgi:hypothetical protein
VAEHSCYLNRSDVRSLLIAQPDENLDITEAILHDIDQLQIHTAEDIRGYAPQAPAPDGERMITVPYNPCLEKLRPGEPFFVLLGRDKQAPESVLCWANARERAEGKTAWTEQAREVVQEMVAYSGAPPARSAASTVEPSPREQELASEVERLTKRLDLLAAGFDVPDGGRYIADWQTRIQKYKALIAAPTTSPEPDALREVLKQIATVCADNAGDECDQKLALRFVAKVASRALARNDRLPPEKI